MGRLDLEQAIVLGKLNPAEIRVCKVGETTWVTAAALGVKSDGSGY
jgi:hypothetical protein